MSLWQWTWEKQQAWCYPKGRCKGRWGAKIRVLVSFCQLQHVHLLLHQDLTLLQYFLLCIMLCLLCCTYYVMFPSVINSNCFVPILCYIVVLLCTDFWLKPPTHRHETQKQLPFSKIHSYTVRDGHSHPLLFCVFWTLNVNVLPGTMLVFWNYKLLYLDKRLELSGNASDLG